MNKDAIQAAHDLEIVRVSVPEWGGHVYIKTIKARTRDNFEMEVTQGGKSMNAQNMRAKLVSIALCDKEGELVFQNTSEGAGVLAKKSALVVDRLFDIAAALAGITEDAQKVLEKNLETDQQGDSPTS